MTYQGKEVFTSDDLDYVAARPGDCVEEAVVDAVMNCLLPICMSSACAQTGDPYGMCQDPTTGAWRPTYATFKRCLDISDIWEYCGYCFLGEVVECGTPPPNMQHTKLSKESISTPTASAASEKSPRGYAA